MSILNITSSVTPLGTGSVSPGNVTNFQGGSQSETATGSGGHLFWKWNIDDPDAGPPSESFFNPESFFGDSGPGERTVTLVANFLWNATATVSGGTGGTLQVTVDGTNIIAVSGNNSTNLVARCADGGTVLITPVPNSGFHFDHWEGDITGSSNPGSVGMTTDKSITAVFLADDEGGGGNPLSFVVCAVLGHYLFGVRGDGTLYSWRVNDPENPDRSGFTQLSLPAGDPKDMVPYRGKLYVINSDSIFVVNIDDPTAPTLETTISASGESLQQMAVVGDTIFVAGAHISHNSTVIDDAVNGLVAEDRPEASSADIAIQGRRAFTVDRIAGFLRSYRIGGFYCGFSSFGSVEADEVTAELFRGRALFLKGGIRASSIGTGGGDFEDDEGVLYAANYVRIGDKYIFTSGSLAVNGGNSLSDPNGVVTATRSSLFLADDGTVWRNTDGADTWVAM